MSGQVIAIVAGIVVVGLTAGARMFVWPPTDPVQHVDAIVVLGGELSRLETGLDLFDDEVSGVLVLSAGTADAAIDRGITCDSVAIICVQPSPETTAGEASAVSALAADRGWSSMAIVTSTYHLTRARVLFGQCFDGALVMVEAPVGRKGASFFRGVLAEIPSLAGGVTFARAC